MRVHEPSRRAGAALPLILLALCLAALFSGCAPAGDGGGTNAQGAQENADPASANTAETPAFPDYVTVNPVAFEEVTVEPVIVAGLEDGSVSSAGEWQYKKSYGRISGLHDETVQQKINDRLKEAYDQLENAPIPPYRGIRAAVPASSALHGMNIYCMVRGNFNNVLSVFYMRNCNYAPPDAGDDFVSVTEYAALNFDLCTGDEISLRDVFKPGADYLSILDDALFRHLLENGAEEEWSDFNHDSPTLASAYEPLSPDQKFTLGDNGYLQLLFGHETLYFETPYFSPYSFTFNLADFGDDVGIYTRFTGEGREPRQLYAAGENPERMLLYRETYALKASPILRNFSKTLASDPGAEFYHASINARCEVPRELEERIFAMLQLDDELRARLEDFRSAHPDEGAYASKYAQLNRIGPFFSLWLEKYVDLGENQHSAETENFTWHADGLAEVRLKDLFRDGFDYEALLREKAEAEFGRTPLYENGAPREGASLEAEKERLLRALAECSPRMGASELYFSTPSTEQQSDAVPRPLHFTLSYKDIGYENLTFFAE
ncbi:MAG: hypothetical protein LBT26_07310 [Clostridiales Family XIII bacterium]|nr:hypothetical protein [Clostridiales Family XIII bacterium]